MEKKRIFIMPKKTTDEKAILKELRLVPRERWAEILTFIRSLHSPEKAPAAERPIVSGADLADSPLFGIWADRTDITDNHQFARELRKRAEHSRHPLGPFWSP
jgi:hypothetical protein